MLGVLNAAIRYNQGTPDKRIEQIHLSNHAMDAVFSGLEDTAEIGLFLLNTCYEDTDLAGDTAARDTAELADVMMPGCWVMIWTGDYIYVPNTGIDGKETYDPYYRVYLMHRHTWQQYKAELSRIDSEWRAERIALAAGTAIQ